MKGSPNYPSTIKTSGNDVSIRIRKYNYYDNDDKSLFNLHRISIFQIYITFIAI